MNVLICKCVCCCRERARQAITLFLYLNNLKHPIVAASNSHDISEASISPSVQLLEKKEEISIYIYKKKKNYSTRHKTALL